MSATCPINVQMSELVMSKVFSGHISFLSQYLCVQRYFCVFRAISHQDTQINLRMAVQHVLQHSYFITYCKLSLHFIRYHLCFCIQSMLKMYSVPFYLRFKIGCLFQFRGKCKFYHIFEMVWYCVAGLRSPVGLDLHFAIFT